MTPLDDTVVIPVEIQDLRGRVGKLETTVYSEHRARLEALEAISRATEARLQRYETILVELQTEQHLGFKAIRGMLGEVLTILGAAQR
jgi:hypothetical protein